jgi:hypothetical protein
MSPESDAPIYAATVSQFGWDPRLRVLPHEHTTIIPGCVRCSSEQAPPINRPTLGASGSNTPQPEPGRRPA